MSNRIDYNIGFMHTGSKVNRIVLSHIVTKWSFQYWLELHLIELLAKEVPWEHSNNSGCCQGYTLLLKNLTARVYCWKIALTQFIEHREFELVPTKSSHHYGLLSLVPEDTHTLPKVKHKPSTNPLIYNGTLPVRYMGAMLAQSL